MLGQAGVNLDQPAAADVQRAWEVMRVFATQQVEDETLAVGAGDDYVLAEYGTYDWNQGAGEHFEVGLSRVFTFSDLHGEFSHAARLNLQALFRPTDELRAVAADSLPSYSLPDLSAFFARALAMRGFVAIRETSPVKLIVDWSDI